MNSPVIGIDFGATYTKIAFRSAFVGGTGDELESHQSKALGEFEDSLIPSLVIETGRDDRPWLFGRQAAEIRPGRKMTVHHNWKSRLVKPDGSEPDPKYLEVAVQFFNWVREQLQDSIEVPFALEEAVVRLCVPAFDHNGSILSRLGQAMQQAGWTNKLILKTSEPKANTIGFCTTGRNIKLWTGCPDWGDMFSSSAPFIQFTRQHLLGDHRAALAVIDIGSFTSDLSIVYWTAGNTDDYLGEGNQYSFAHGIVDDLDMQCLERILADVGESWDELDFDEHERIKKRLYSHQSYDLSGNRIGGPKVEQLITAAIDGFVERLIEFLTPHVESVPINWFLLTGGGSNIPGIANRLTAYLCGLRVDGVRPVRLPTNDSGNRLDTALGATSIILDPRSTQQTWNGPQPKTTGRPPLPPLEDCSCQGANRDCIRCGGSGILDESQQSRRASRPASQAIPESVVTPRVPEEVETEDSPPEDLGTTLEFINSEEPALHPFTADQIRLHTLEGWMGELVFPDQPKNYPAFKGELCSNNAGRKNAAWYRLLCLGCTLGARVSRQTIRNFWSTTLERTNFWDITTIESLDQAKLDQFFENLIHREFRSVYAEGEQAELLRRVFYDFRKLHYLVYFNDFANVVLEVLDDADHSADPIKFLRSGWLPDGTRWRGVIGQSMTSPLLFLMREWRRMGLITTDRHDHHCFYMNGTAARAAIRKGWLDWNRYGRGTCRASSMPAGRFMRRCVKIAHGRSWILTSLFRFLAHDDDTITPMNTGSRVRHLDHPEFGYGTIKLIESDPLDDREILQVAFDWRDGTVSCSRGRLSEIDALATGGQLASAAFGTLGELRTRIGSALILSENARTAGFTRSFVTPLPHQAYLLEKVQGQRYLGHLIADDVGMGKTIEAGLIISAERQTNPKLRVLILAPKNVILQWQDEMEEHFGLFFRVAKRDFEIRHPNHWSDINLVIASRDGLKQEKYRDVLAAIDAFDLVVVDEAHALTARRDFLSGEIERTGNFRFAEWLSAQHVVAWENDQQGAPRSPRFLFLTATPHQGDDTRFLHLLSLVRPDLIDPDAGDGLTDDLERLRACVSRTAKKKAVDWDGKPIFKGHESRTIDISLTDAEQHILRMLGWYVRERMVFKATGRAEALVRALAMHTYQKIAASSWLALEDSLVSRLAGRTADPEDIDEESLLEYELVGGDNEIEALNELLALVQNLKEDTKAAEFSKLFDPTAGFRFEGEKVLVFTQYRSTQQYLRSILEAQGLKVAVINGTLSIDQRREQRAYFEDSADVLVSTEAGSEGANLQRKCHLLVNFDSPWNPMRLLQRVGRLDRYGQKLKVTAITLRTPQTWDAEISRIIETKLAVIQERMGLVADEDYRDMIVGAVYDGIDVGSIMAAADWDLNASSVARVIDEEISKAQQDRHRLKQILSEAVGMPDGFESKRADLGSKEFHLAFKWAAESREIMLRETRTRENQHLPGVYHFALPETFRMLLRASRECYVVFDRDRFSEVRGEVLGRARGQEIRPILVGIGEPVTDWLMTTAISADSDTVAFALKAYSSPNLCGKFWVSFIARWRAGSTTPDYLGVFEINPDDNSAQEVPPSRVFQELEKPESVSLPNYIRLPDLSAARKSAQAQVSSILERSPSTNRNNLRFVTWAVIAWQ